MRRLLIVILIALPMMMSAQAIDSQDFARVDSSYFTSDTVMVFEDTMPQRPCIFDSMPYVTVHQDSLITRLVQDKIAGVVRGQEMVDGFRVQIYSSNRQQLAKAEAIELEHRLERALPVKIYTQYISPFWKVRVGDFTTYEEAKAFKEQLLQHFPYLRQDAYIVRDLINVHP